MKTVAKQIFKAVALSLGATLSIGQFAMAQTTLPPLHHTGDIAYLSGGIGSDEANQIKAVSAQWPLTLEFVQHANHRAQYTAAARVDIEKANQQPVLKTVAEGPFLLARLKPDTYIVKALFNGKTIQHTVTVKAGASTKLVFEFPSDTVDGHS